MIFWTLGIVGCNIHPIMSEFNPKYSTQAVEPIFVNPGQDPDRIGKHYAALHDLQCGSGYRALGEDVDIRYTTSLLPDGRIKIEVVVDHY